MRFVTSPGSGLSPVIPSFALPGASRDGFGDGCGLKRDWIAGDQNRAVRSVAGSRGKYSPRFETKGIRNVVRIYPPLSPAYIVSLQLF